MNFSVPWGMSDYACSWLDVRFSSTSISFTFGHMCNCCEFCRNETS
jgi:hypothetical protein